MIEITVTDLEGTGVVADNLARLLRQGDCIILTGPLGVGKTLFVGALAHALGVTQTVTSPTFSIANIYETGRIPILHIDAYRLSGIKEFRDLGLEEYFQGCVTIIEWGEKVATEFPDKIEMSFAYQEAGEQHRKITFHPAGHWLGRLSPEALKLR